MKTKRRDFFKITTAGATGLVLARANRAFADPWPASGTIEINPNISNMRVVGCVDPTMMKSTPTTMDFAPENAVVDSARVAANMDAMAMQLANKCTPDEAWRAIFRSSKPWASTVVAMKINAAISGNMARVAVLEKLCRVLNGFGVPAANLIIYDGSIGTTTYSSYFSKTDASKIPGVVGMQNSNLGGSQIDAPLPDGTTAPCSKWIADGTVDILINIPTNKGHSAFGGATLSLKNHFGTFKANHFETDAGYSAGYNKFIEYVFNINKSEAIIGGSPPRQQLCIVDSLIANKVDNLGVPDAMPCYLVMGTFAPSVDYLTIKEVREKVMGCTHTASITNQLLTKFNYTTSDPVWVLVPPAGSDAGAGSCGNSGTGGTGSGGTSGSGGTGSGGTSGSGGTGSGGTSGSGGTGSGGKSGSGGAGSGGSGGLTATGGATATGGTTSSGGAGGSGGATTSAASATGGMMSSGGTSGDATTAAGRGCRCDLGGISRGAGRFGALLAFGAVVAGQLRRLFARRDMLARPTQPDAPTDASGNENSKE